MARFFTDKNSLIILILLAFALGPLAVFSRGLSQNNAIETWLPSETEQLQRLNRFRDRFGRDEVIVMSWDNSGLDDPRMGLLAERLESEVDEVVAVHTPVQFLERMTSPGNLSQAEAESRLEGFLLGPADVKSGKRAVANLVVLSGGIQNRPEVMKKIREVAANRVDLGRDEEHPNRDELYLAGGPVVNAALDVWGKETIDGLLKFMGAVCGILCFVLLRNVWLAFMVLLTAGYSIVLSRALVAGTGGSMNLVMVVMSPLVLVLALSGAIHMVNYWCDAVRNGGRKGAVGRAWNIGWKPCVLASVTTAIGLISLGTSQIHPVRQFGIYAGIGSLLVLLMVLLALPAALHLLHNSRIRKSETEWGGWTALGDWLSRNHLLVTTVSMGIFVAAAWALPNVETQVKAIHYFPEHHVAGLPPSPYPSYAFLEENVTSLIPVETVVRFQSDKTNGRPKRAFLDEMELVSEIQREIGKMSEVGGTLSLASFLREPPQDRFARPAFSLFVERTINNRKETASFLRTDETGANLWRITARIPALESIDYGDFFNEIQKPIESVLAAHGSPSDVSFEVTGLVPVIYEAQQQVLWGLMQSFSLAFGIIYIVMVIWMGSFWAGLISMIPNLTPVVFVFGAMSWAGINVDIASMMTASVALGIAVDGTLHYLTWFRHGLNEGKSRKASVILAMRHCGPALLQTSLIAGCGLAVLGYGEFGPTTRFGWMMGALLGAALIADLILLPSLLAGKAGWLLERMVSVEKNRKEEPLLAGPHGQEPEAGSPSRSDPALHETVS